MDIWTILLIVLIFCAFGGGFGGIYPHVYGFGGAGVLIVILIVVLLLRRGRERL